jgi:hypothetical protein
MEKRIGDERREKEQGGFDDCAPHQRERLSE